MRSPAPLVSESAASPSAVRPFLLFLIAALFYLNPRGRLSGIKEMRRIASCNAKSFYRLFPARRETSTLFLTSAAKTRIVTRNKPKPDTEESP